MRVKIQPGTVPQATAEATAETSKPSVPLEDATPVEDAPTKKSKKRPASSTTSVVKRPAAPITNGNVEGTQHQGPTLQTEIPSDPRDSIRDAMRLGRTALACCVRHCVGGLRMRERPGPFQSHRAVRAKGHKGTRP